MQSKQASANYLKNKTRTTQITLVIEKDNISCGVSNIGKPPRNELVFHPEPRNLGAKSMKTNPIGDRRSTFFKLKPNSEEESATTNPFNIASNSGSSGTAGTNHSDKFGSQSIRQR